MFLLYNPPFFLPFVSQGLDQHPSYLERFATTTCPLSKYFQGTRFACLAHCRIFEVSGVFWLLLGIPANFSSKDVDEKSEYASIQEGINDWKIPGYRGPHPPVGVHRYEFKLYALDTTLKLGHKVTNL
jgi:hypothetical protein